jgi:hypothetical protein
MKKLIYFIFLLLSVDTYCQSIFIDNTSYITLKDGGNVYIEDTSVNAIYSSGGGFYVADTLNGFVEWNIENNKGQYVVPFLTYSNVYVPIILNITTSGVGSSVKFSTTDTPITSITSYYDANSIGRYWSLDFANFTTIPSGMISLTYDSNATTYPYYDLITKYHNPSNIWTDVSLGVYSYGLVTFPIGVYNSNKKWTLVNTPSLLPITLLYFKGKNKQNKFSRLTWETALEINNNGFEIEKSLDGFSFYTIGWVTGNGNSTVSHLYKFDDYKIELGGTYYYRLKQVDYDGQFEYSNMVSVNFDDITQTVEYYTLLGQKLDFNSGVSDGVYIKVINGEASLIGIIKNQ